ncbi:mandelate racemase/muconate lactonizing enzyme family protein [Maribacter sp. PR1]|uniref:Mandelate racemase/muconate lactonizing enzyme family protein n=1 Tax=Maribacter cobaltidurans TaxID=1178778 RepID=A0ABU7IQ74_9FLAO|nr:MULTISPECIES: mandelate racemase/muconate lactonizing enzyme family protein [Maribacter]MDC6387657.1 mandelate racemase/muconate lactonizing enzyme family protein [Maribacter sp. PR1]MEE1975045.1 mandelate racemase/muconate lactonizing enzyme family protein [Maribacter cobaltidurans]
MKITNIEAFWLRCPIPKEKQHFSDYGLLTNFDMTLVVVTTDTGLQGFGEAKAAVGSSGSCASIVSCVENELKPQLIGQDARNISRIWEMVYNGTRDHYSLSRGRKFPILGRRGLTISALSGIDTALWDIKGKSLGVPVVELLGGSCRDKMEAYASGGWAKVDAIGEQLKGYTSKGFSGVKMRVGIMDETVKASVERVKAAREALGDNIKLMTDAHGTFSVPEAKQFCRGVADCNLYWFEEPINPDNKIGTAEVRSNTDIPIAAGESEYTAFDIRDMIAERALDVLQPDCAIIGGITEAIRVSQLAHTYQLELAPHCWGSAFSFMAGVSVAFASPSANVIEFSLGGNPMMYDLVEENIRVDDKGMIKAPDKPGLGVTPNWDFVKDFKQ